MDDYALVLNAGSSSLKFCIYRRPEVEAWRLEARGQIEGIGTAPHSRRRTLATEVLADDPLDGAVDGRTALDALGAWLRSQYGGARVLGVGHRVVHGGARYAGPTIVTPEVLENLRELIPLAPLHQPHNLAAIDAVFDRLPGVPQVACFDTSFHRGQPAVAEVIPLPREICRSGLQRYGFHGLSERIHRLGPASSRSRDRPGPRHRGSPGQRRQPVRPEQWPERRQQPRVHRARWALHGDQAGCHRSRRDPLPLSKPGLSARDVETILYKKSGLLGISGISNDMRVLLEAPTTGARLAVDYFVYRAAREIGWLAAGSGWDRRPGVHRRHWGELSRDSPAHLGSLLMARGSIWTRTRTCERDRGSLERGAGCRPG